MKQIEEELVTLNSKTPCLSESTELINEIPVKLPSQLLISKITTSFNENFKQLSMNSNIEVEKFEPGTTFERTINEIKYNHLKIISSATINISAITLFDKNFKQLSMNSSIEVEKSEPGTTFENTTNDIKDNNLKSITSAAMNLSAITFLNNNIEQISMNRRIEVARFEIEPTFEELLMRSKIII